MPPTLAVPWLLIGMCFLSLCSMPSRSEAHPLERVAFASSGRDCSLYRVPMTAALQGMESVTRVEPNLIPDHILVDRDGARHTEQELVRLLNKLVARHDRSHVEIVQSCITAGATTAFSAR
jgi:hypothetical protein